jgi:uncharacterized protein YjeT (DUF2065 family)
MMTFFSFLLAATSHQVFQGNVAMSTIEWRPTCFFFFRSPAESPISQRRIVSSLLRQCGDELRQAFQGKAAMIFFEGMGRNYLRHIWKRAFASQIQMPAHALKRWTRSANAQRVCYDL